jgi:hypothetical protein
VAESAEPALSLRVSPLQPTRSWIRLALTLSPCLFGCRAPVRFLGSGCGCSAFVMQETRSGQSVPAFQEEPTLKAVLCSKCGTRNDPDRKYCDACAAHLYVTCPSCRGTNDRANSRCHLCGSALHRSAWRRLRRKLLSRHGRMAAYQVLLFVLAIGLLWWYISLLGQGSPFSATPE